MTPGRLASLIAFSLMWGLPARAQSPSYIYGHIADPSAAGAPGASVSVVNEDNGFRHSAVSQNDGAYSVGPLRPGSYKLTVRKEGFRTMIRFHVRLDGIGPARADFALSLGSVQETITVEDTPDRLAGGRRDEVAVNTQISQDEIEKLPLDASGLLGLAELAPGTTVVPATRGDPGQFVTDGQRPNTNSFAVDGISMNQGVSAGGVPAQTSGGSLPVLSAFGSLDSLIPTGSVEEFEIRTSTSAAKFGRLPGAAVAVTSRSGSDEFHGAAGYTFRDQFLAANDWFANQAGEARQAFSENGVNGALGGPLWRNRTFFFLAYERIALVQPFTWLEPEPSLAARAAAPSWAQPALALFPIPNGPSLGNGLAAWNGSDSRPAGLQAGSLRIDHAFSDRLALFAHYSDSPSDNQFGEPLTDHLNFRSWSGTIGLSFHPSSDVGWDLRLNGSDTAALSVWSGAAGCTLEPLAALLLPAAPSCDELVRFEIDGVGQLVSGSEGQRWQRQWQAVQSISWKRGSHSIQAGADFLRIEPERRDANGTLSIIADNLAALDDTDSFWEARSPPVDQSTRVDELSLWLHDTWQPLPRLTVVAGLRWEYSPPPPALAAAWDATCIDPDVACFLDPAQDIVQPESRPLWLTPYGHFAPRLGFAYSPGKNARTVFRAGAGLYYDSSLSIATDVINDGPLSLGFESARNGLFSTDLIYGFLPNLRLPRVTEWNVSLEHSLSAHDLVSIGYVGSAGRDLIRREVGGLGSTPTNWVALTTNDGSSNYNALTAQYRRRLGRGLEALVSYAWSHSMDNASSDSFLLWAGSGLTPGGDYGSSDFDLRHSASASFDWALPGFAHGWSLDGIVRGRSGFPITVLESEEYEGISFMNAFRPELVPNVPLWIAAPNSPGGRILNPLAFSAAPAGLEGDLGRNAITGFGMWQLDLSLRREFRLADRRSLELRIAAFNALNHPNFADPVRFLDSPYFGQSTSMLNLMLGTGSPGSGLSPLLESGGPRSVEVMLRFRF
jgi:Carboxypeptidase regulatory-like domain/TonB-dependent Receptor Plug Domain